jgi:hypothetical protein
MWRVDGIQQKVWKIGPELMGKMKSDSELECTGQCLSVRESEEQ